MDTHDTHMQYQHHCHMQHSVKVTMLQVMVWAV